MKSTKRLLSLLLAVCLMLGSLSLSAMAAEPTYRLASKNLEYSGGKKYLTLYDYEFDELGRLVREYQWDGLESTTHGDTPTYIYYYNEAGALVKADWHTYAYDYVIYYNERGQQERRTCNASSDPKHSYWEYDSEGKLIKEVIGGVASTGNESTFEYDSKGRLTQKTTVIGKDIIKVYLYTYNDKDQLAEMTSRWNSATGQYIGVTRYSYDSRGLLVKEEDFDAEGVRRSVTEYTYKETGGSTKPEEPDAKPEFKDVTPGAFYSDAVVWAVSNGITQGTGNGNFSPNKPCTRGQAVTFLWRAAGCPEPKSSTSKFKDLKAGASYVKAVLWAVEEGITSGINETTFGPNDTCTRGQIVTFLYRAAGSPAVSGKNPFTDAQKGYFVNAILWAGQNGVTQGTTATTFEPDSKCTRGHIVTFLYRDRAE